MAHLLFLCTGNSARSQMAEAFAWARAPDAVTAESAGTDPADRVHPVAIDVMREVSLDISGQRPKGLSAVRLSEIDVAITLCAHAAENCRMILPGQPPQVNWDLPDPAAAQGDPEAVREVFRRSRDEIRRLVDELFDHGYLEALTHAKRTEHLVLDSLAEGIIVHDLQRRITYFNRAAEAITGYDRDEVVGRDCHEIFPGGFCGGKCGFADDAPPRLDAATYSLERVTKSGEPQLVDMCVHAVKERDGQVRGVLASVRDVTREHDLARRLGEIESFAGIIGRDSQMLDLFDLIRSVAAADVPVLIQGESGTGKELVAAAVHNEGPRAAKLFVPVNCGALPEGLLESELFGHVRGAFTGAIRDKKGRFELAHGGTIFLDEIGDVSPAMQVKLLRVLQEGAFERVGSTATIRVDVRVISATNKDLQAEIAAARFRKDLFYRLCVVPITLPPLRERRGDIPLLVDHILKRVTAQAGREPPSLAPAALDALLSHEWPGNVRELQNALQFALVKCRDTRIELDHLPPHIVRRVRYLPPPARPTGGRRRKLDAERVLRALRATHGNKAEAARNLGVGRATLYRFLRDNPDLLPRG